MIVGSEGRELAEGVGHQVVHQAAAGRPDLLLRLQREDRPVQMAAFGKLFGAKSVTGFTWWTIKQPVNVKLPKGVSAEKIKKALDPFVPYSVELIPAAEGPGQDPHLAQGPRDQPRRRLRITGRRHRYCAADPLRRAESRKPWKEAVKKTIKLADAAATEGLRYESDRGVQAADGDAQVTGERPLCRVTGRSQTDGDCLKSEACRRFLLLAAHVPNG